MHIIERYTNLLMDKPVEKTEDEFFHYIKDGTRPMMIAQLHVTKMHYLYTMGRYGDAVEEGRKASLILTYITQFKEEVGTPTPTRSSPAVLPNGDNSGVQSTTFIFRWLCWPSAAAPGGWLRQRSACAS